MIRWFARNDIAANLLLVSILLGGVYMALKKIPLEVQPTTDFGKVDVRMEYRGGSPEDVEEHIILPIERALRDVQGIKTITSSARRGSASFDVEGEDGYDLEKLRDDIETQVDTINTFPGETERPRISIPNTSNWKEVLSVAVTGDLSDLELYKVAKRVSNDLLELPQISRVSLRGDHAFEIAIEADHEKLHDYGLSIQDLSDAIRRSSLALSAGAVRTAAGDVMIRTDSQAYELKDFAKIVVQSDDGAQLTLGDVAKISDGFENKEHISRFNGEKTIVVDVLQGEDESAIKISNAVSDYVKSSQGRFSDGIHLYVWDDESTRIRDRLSTLATSLVSGAVLVLIVLGVFLRPMLAFWVVIGIPVSFAGGIILMPYFGLTANTMSIFGFIIVLGIVVDDAIVTGENIYTKLREDISPLDAAVIGTTEVATPVTFGALTTIVAFIPLMFFDGYWASWTTQIPPVVSAVIIFSLIESKFILPSHLKHLKTHRKKLNAFGRFQKAIADGLESGVAKYYAPLLRICATHRYATFAGFLAIGLLAVGLHKGKHLGFVPMPTIERDKINARLDMVDNTAFEETEAKIKYIADCARELEDELIDPGTGKSLIVNILTDAGGNPHGGGDPEEGFISLEILPPDQRSEPGPTNDEIGKLWQAKVTNLKGVRDFRVWGSFGGRGGGGDEAEAMEIHLRGDDSETKRRIAEEIEDLFQARAEIDWANADVNQGRDELSISLKPRALEMGITERNLASQIRQSFFGEEVQRIQRDGEELRVMVRLPEDERESMYTFDTMNIRAPDGTNIPFSTIARAELNKASGRLERVDGAQITRISASPKEKTTDIVALADILEPQIDAIVNQSPELSWVWQGFIKEDRETGNRYLWLYGGLILALYALLAIPFRSLLQPFIVLLAVPFGIIGAYAGHMVMGVTPSWLSVFGIMALTGVVVNDSIVLVDFINQKREEGMKVKEAVMISGVRRFRPILLTSITTFAGLIPLMFDKALHAQFLKPMAISLGYGILFATAITLLLIPAAYLILEDFKRLVGKCWRWYKSPFQKTEEEESLEM